MMVPLTSTSTKSTSNRMPKPHISPMPTAAAAQMAWTAPEPMNLDTITKLQEELHAYIGQHRKDRFNRQDSRETRPCYNYGEQGHCAGNCQKNQPTAPGRERRESSSGTPRRDLNRDSKGLFGSRFRSRERPRSAIKASLKTWWRTCSRRAERHHQYQQTRKEFDTSECQSRRNRTSTCDSVHGLRAHLRTSRQLL